MQNFKMYFIESRTPKGYAKEIKNWKLKKSKYVFELLWVINTIYLLVFYLLYEIERSQWWCTWANLLKIFVNLTFQSRFSYQVSISREPKFVVHISFASTLKMYILCTSQRIVLSPHYVQYNTLIAYLTSTSIMCWKAASVEWSLIKKLRPIIFESEFKYRKLTFLFFL